MKQEFLSGFARLIQYFLEHSNLMWHSALEYRSKLHAFDRFCLEHFPGESILNQ